MTENEILTINGKEVILYREVETNLYRFSEDAVDMLLDTLEECEKYRAIGTVEDFKAFKTELSERYCSEHDKEIRNKAIDDFAEAMKAMCHGIAMAEKYIDNIS